MEDARREVSVLFGLLWQPKCSRMQVSDGCVGRTKDRLASACAERRWCSHCTTNVSMRSGAKLGSSLAIVAGRSRTWSRPLRRARNDSSRRRRRANLQHSTTGAPWIPGPRSRTKLNHVARRAGSMSPRVASPPRPLSDALTQHRTPGMVCALPFQVIVIGLAGLLAKDSRRRQGSTTVASANACSALHAPLHGGYLKDG